MVNIKGIKDLKKLFKIKYNEENIKVKKMMVLQELMRN
jgi:hypothetical protein